MRKLLKNKNNSFKFQFIFLSQETVKCLKFLILESFFIFPHFNRINLLIFFCKYK